MSYFNYIAIIAGGYGPDTWDAEREIQAENILEALIKLEDDLVKDGLNITNVISIEQAD